EAARSGLPARDQRLRGAAAGEGGTASARAFGVARDADARHAREGRGGGREAAARGRGGPAREGAGGQGEPRRVGGGGGALSHVFGAFFGQRHGVRRELQPRGHLLLPPGRRDVRGGRVPRRGAVEAERAALAHGALQRARVARGG